MYQNFDVQNTPQIPMDDSRHWWYGPGPWYPRPWFPGPWFGFGYWRPRPWFGGFWWI